MSRIQSFIRHSGTAVFECLGSIAIAIGVALKMLICDPQKGCRGPEVV